MSIGILSLLKCIQFVIFELLIAKKKKNKLINYNFSRVIGSPPQPYKYKIL